VPALLQAADAFLHPAYEENTGNVILEAAIAGLPVVATDVCGYAHFIEDFQLGAVVYSPFQVENLAAKVGNVLDRDRQYWRQQGANLAHTGDIFSRPQRAAEYIEAIGVKRGIC
jgi:UDP-glucose:(heptosyl)LPS alpha-1,3-glucosyltransferase